MLLAWAVYLSVMMVGALAGSTCYQLDGTPYSKIRPDDGDWVPCDPSAQVSTCCSDKDYCMGNGLCLDAGANNMFSIQDAPMPHGHLPASRRRRARAACV